MRRALRSTFKLLSWIKQNRIKSLIPNSIFNALKVYNYYIWLGYTILTQDTGMNPVKIIRALSMRRKRVLFYPDVPWESSVMYQLCLILRYEITNNPARSFDLGVRWKSATYSIPDARLADLAKHRQIINIGCNDISKSHVNAVFRQVFGYDASVDPLTFEGKYVKKSDQNATHDGEIIAGPITHTEDGRIYQILIDNEVDEGHVMDIRVPVVGSSIPLVFLYFRPIEIRFSAAISRIQAVETPSVFDEREQNQILRFCATMGLEYGELDVLRNRSDGRIYIVDVNPTPHGPPTHLGTQREGMKRLAAALAKNFSGEGWYENAGH